MTNPSPYQVPVLDRDLGDGLVLRDYRDADAEATFAVVDGDRERLERYLPWLTGTRTVDDVRGFHRGQQEAVEAGNALHGSLLLSGCLVGRLSFNRIDREQGVAEVGYWGAGASEGRGYMTRGLLALCEHGFATLNLHRLELYTVVENERSQVLARRCGFRQEGVWRSCAVLHGRRVDHVWFARLRDDPV